MKVGILTLGCKVNTYESEFIKHEFVKHGYEIGVFEDNCDIYIINTCTVTNNADSKSRKMIHNVVKRKNNAVLVVCGCYVESSHHTKIDGVDIMVGNYNKSKIVDLVENYIKDKKIININDNIFNVNFENMELDNFNDRTRAFVKIEDGCENFCSYCIIPFVRGKCRSKNLDLVLTEIKKLVNNNYKEIVLTGIHTGHYGQDINTNFSNALEKILEIDNLKRLRISSLEITEIDDKFLFLLKNNKLCNHLHIPLQTGNDKILKLMNRKYDILYFLEKVKKIREVRPDISLTTDVIVGFPNETDEDFNETINFIKKIGFTKIHVFPYSKRENTVAALMKNEVSPPIKKKRVNELISLSNSLEEKYYNSFINKELEVLIEKNDGIYSYGHTSNYMYLKIKQNLDLNKCYTIKVSRQMISKIV